MSNNQPQQNQFKLSNPVHFLALGFGAGLLKPGPGTWGTLVALPIYWLLAVVLSLSLPAYGVVVLLGFLIGVFLCSKAAQDAGVHDHGAIVWDEIIGMLVTLFAIPPSAANIIFGFLLFRLFDIFKPWPIKPIDRKVHGGFGIMIDDVVAGVAACVILHLLQSPMSQYF